MSDCYQITPIYLTWDAASKPCSVFINPALIFIKTHKVFIKSKEILGGGVDCVRNLLPYHSLLLPLEFVWCELFPGLWRNRPYSWFFPWICSRRKYLKQIRHHRLYAIIVFAMHTVRSIIKAMLLVNGSLYSMNQNMSYSILLWNILSSRYFMNVPCNVLQLYRDKQYRFINCYHFHDSNTKQL